MGMICLTVLTSMSIFFMLGLTVWGKLENPK